MVGFKELLRRLKVQDQMTKQHQTRLDVSIYLHSLLLAIVKEITITDTSFYHADYCFVLQGKKSCTLQINNHSFVQLLNIELPKCVNLF